MLFIWTILPTVATMLNVLSGPFSAETMFRTAVIKSSIEEIGANFLLSAASNLQNMYLFGPSQGMHDGRALPPPLKAS